MKKAWVLTKPHYRDIHGLDFVEAICPHDVGHHKGVHGCHDGDDGKSCCSSCPPKLWEQVTDEL